MESRVLLMELGTRGPPELDRLQDLLESRLIGRVGGFHLIVQEQGLILRGQSRTYHAKQLAQHAVMEATDLPIVANEIEVF